MCVCVCVCVYTRVRACGMGLAGHPEEALALPLPSWVLGGDLMSKRQARAMGQCGPSCRAGPCPRREDHLHPGPTPSRVLPLATL